MDLQAIKQRSWTSSVTYDAGTIITYNLSIGAEGKDLRRCWEDHPEFHPLPTFTSIAVINIMGKVTVDLPTLLPLFNPQKHPHVHAEHYLELKRPLPKSGILLSSARIIDVVDRRTGVAVIVGITTLDAKTETEICYSEWTSFLIKMPGGGASRPSPSSPNTHTQSATLLPSRPPEVRIDYKTTSEQGALYRAATGEWNPMHIDPDTARKAGFSGPILSGTCTIGIGVRHVIDAFAGGDAARFKSVRLRLSKPVFPGEVVTTRMWSGDDGKIVYQQVAEDGRVVISQAEIDLHGDGMSRVGSRGSQL
ncbi:MaoC like domain-containing protein [Aspergillus karnatakaensis]|uniref:MaoC like domain-containing protein n=1 Tax=Aspergillus karnatakaensis TaxID=1810916 RepID=UPI003CCCD942